MKLEINRDGPTPLHTQAEMLLRRLIEQDEYKDGKLLPKETELSEQLGISRNTLRQAMNTIVNEGLLIRKKGYGTRVARKRVLSAVTNWHSFSQEMKALGVVVYNFELHVKWAFPNNEMTDFFDIPQDTRILWLKRLRGKKEYPFAYFISAFNPAIGLTGDEDFSRPLYELLEQDYSVVVKRSTEEIGAAAADEFIAEKLEINSGDPILVRKRFVYDTEGIPTEYNIGYFRADSFTYAIECNR